MTEKVAPWLVSTVRFPNCIVYYCMYTTKLEVGEPDYTLAHALLPNGDRIFGNLHFGDVETWELPMLG